MTEDVGEMDFDTYCKIFDSGVPYAVKLNWRGEPLLHKKLPLFITYAKNKGVVEVLLNTNGHLLDRDTALGLADAGLDWLIISIDGATKYTYESIRQGGDFEALVKNIMNTSLLYQRIGKTGRCPKIRLQICKQPDNEHEIGRWKKFFLPFADELRIGKLFDPQGKRGYKTKIPKTCTQPWQRIVVDWKGNIYPCCSDYLEKMFLGNINYTTIHEAWHSKEMNDLRESLARFGRHGHLLCYNCSSYC